MDNKVNALIQKSIRRFNSIPVSKSAVSSIESELNIILNEYVVKISVESNHEYSSRFEWLGFPEGILKKTLQLRAEGLPHRYIILADQGDAGSIFLETQDSPEKPSPVIWCDMEDVYNLCDEGVFKYNPTIWDSFTDFFEYLVNEEEKLQKEEAG